MPSECAAEEQAVADLESVVASLQAELNSNPPPDQKPELKKQIAKMVAQLKEAKAKLAECLAPTKPQPSFTTQWPLAVHVWFSGPTKGRAEAHPANEIALSFDDARTSVWLGRVEVHATVLGVPITLVLTPTTTPGSVASPAGATALRDMSLRMAIELSAKGFPLVGDVERSAFVTLGTAERHEVVGSEVRGEALSPNGWLSLVGTVDFPLTDGLANLHVVLQLVNRVKAPLPW